MANNRNFMSLSPGNPPSTLRKRNIDFYQLEKIVFPVLKTDSSGFLNLFKLNLVQCARTLTMQLSSYFHVTSSQVSNFGPTYSLYFSQDRTPMSRAQKSTKF